MVLLLLKVVYGILSSTYFVCFNLILRIWWEEGKGGVGRGGGGEAPDNIRLL
jgi:hypothetical protein